jgi:hypothetical protein
MGRILRHRPSPALVIALIALFVALGGVSYGVATNSIDSREIKNNSVSTRDLKNNSVTSLDVKNGALGRSDFAPGAAPVGPAGPAGPPGADGRPGSDGRDGFGTLAYATRFGIGARGAAVKRLLPGEQLNGVSPCPSGTFPTGGDVIAFETADPDVIVPEPRYLVASAFNINTAGTPDGWFAALDNQHGVEIDVLLEVICANANQLDTDAIAAVRRRALR